MLTDSSYIHEPVHFLVLVIMLALWGVLGLLFWIPLLARTTILFPAIVLLSTLAGGIEHYSRIQHARHSLDGAVKFYMSGFDTILDMHRKRGQQADTSLPPIPPITWRLLVKWLLDTAWTVLFWTITLGTLKIVLV